MISDKKDKLRIFYLKMLTWLSGREIFAVRSFSRSEDACRERLEDALFERDKSGARRFVAPLPANKLLRREGLRAHTYAWNDDTVNTPRRLSVFFVVLDTWDNKLYTQKKNS